ncbi:FAD-binding oxidoreductase [Marinicellulosiphila megalodicopiae]|uniref:FAD-binding oxidoreductase n=1 Tax=Marinicellulosiphila megalodicopiae TaxID=2724896 RepID=UPI003BB1C799
MTIPQLPTFNCSVYTKDSSEYQQYAYQYASTSHPIKDMSPGAIITPSGTDLEIDADIKQAIKYARDNNLAIAVRTGGNQYSGLSSTASNNIQIDISQTFRDWEYTEKTGILKVGVSYTLLEFNKKLEEMGLFMPTGQCYDVFVGGHVQTGGYGQLCRAFGLFSDQLISFDMYTADGKFISVDAKSHPDLFFAVLGGGPGNYGVVTHIYIKPLKDSDHSQSRSFMQFVPYDLIKNTTVLQELFQLTIDWKNAPGDYDFSLTVTSAEENWLLNQTGFASKDDYMCTYFGKNFSSPFEVLLVYFQFSDNGTAYDKKWCDQIKKILDKAFEHPKSILKAIELDAVKLLSIRCNDNVVTPISKAVNTLWTYKGTREFNYPYMKNGQVTNEVAQKDWPTWAVGRIDQMLGRGKEGLMLFCQCQCFGGEDSAYFKNKKNGTAYAWRDVNVGYNLDVFYDPTINGSLEKATAWQSINHSEGVGEKGKFSIESHRWFWATHGNLNMSESWSNYYSEADYKRCLDIKQTTDASGIFSPNKFVPTKL